MEINKEKILKNINSIIAALLIAVCFFPMFQLNSSDLGYWNDLGMSGFGALLGLEFSDGSAIGMCIPAIFLILCPLVLILSNYVKQMQNIRKNAIYIAPVGSIIALFLTKMSVDSRMNTSISVSIGFWIYLLLDILLLILAYLQFKNISLNEEEIRNFVKDTSIKLGNTFQEMDTVQCPNCGNRVGKGKKFCTNCGSPVIREETESKKVQCPQCGRLVAVTESFCSECGAKLEIPQKSICRNCGMELSANAKFCHKCGTPKG